MDKLTRSLPVFGYRHSICLWLAIVLIVINAVGSLATPWEGRALDLEGNQQADKFTQQNEVPALGTNYQEVDPTANAYVDKLAKLLTSKVRRFGSGRWTPFAEQLDGFQKQQKRQIRYHQCYFNPISCFRKRK